MEDQPRFNLNESIRQWRLNLSKSPAFRSDDLDELESHLRDSAAMLENKGLADHEAFWVAAGRIGSTQGLDLEFGKVNANLVWRNRILWMVTGCLAFGALSGTASLIGTLVTLGIYSLTGGVKYLGPASSVVFLGALFSLSLWVWRSGNRSSGLICRLGVWMKTHPVAATLGAMAIPLCLQAGNVATRLLSARTLPPSTMGPIYTWGAVASYLTLLIWPLIFGWLLAHRSPKTAR